jgi:hypothetical protein
MSEVDVYELYAIAAEAKCDYRTVRSALAGKRVVPAVRAAIDAALAKLGRAPTPTSQFRTAVRP